MYVKIHKSETAKIIAVCDEDLIGKEFEEGNLYLKVSETFFKGEKKNKNEIKKILKDANSANFVGKESVSIAVELGLVDKKNIIKIKGVSHAQYFEL